MVLQAVASGLVLGLVYAGIGAGFSLIMATGRLMNLAHGEFVLVGGYILYVLCHGIGWPWPAALALPFSAARSSGPLCLLSSAGCHGARWTAWR